MKGIDKRILKIKIPSTDKRPKQKGKWRAAWKGYPVKSQKRINALMDYRIPLGFVLNPWGRRGRPKRLRTISHMKRRRLRLQEEKKRALEMHELQQLARENAVAAMQTLIDISQDQRAPEPSRIAASAVILDRGYGKSSQVTMSANLNHGKTNEITGDELDKRIGQALQRVEELTRRTPKAPPSPNRPANLRKLH